MTDFRKRNVFALAAIVAGSVLTGVAISLPGGSRGDALAQGSEARTGPVNQNERTLAHAEELSTAFRNVAEALRPSVVSISTRTEIGGGRARRPLPPGVPPEFRDFFGFGGGVQQPRVAEGMGSGVIVHPDGYILTNNHVVKDADELTVELFDGRKVTGEIIGTDPPTDLAVVKIDLPNLRPATFGSAEDIRVGDWVLAIGSPFGLDQTVTAGIISGKNRVQRIIADGRGFEDFLQTDAAINPGNSGGPLVNLRGELVGINTAILSRSGGNAGIGFSIPETLARPVLRSIIENGEVKRGFLGAQVVDVNPQTKRDYDLKADNGAMIRSVLEDQPADQAGLKPGDVVTELDGREVTTGTQLRNYIASRPPGTVVSMKVNRDGKAMQVRVNLKERSDEAMAIFNSGGMFGAELVPVTPETARQYGYEGLDSGLIVTSIEDGSPAAQAELQVGDVILSADGQRLRSVQQLAEAYQKAQQRGRPLRCIVRQGGTEFFLLIR